MQRIGTIATLDEADARIAALLPIATQLDLPRTLKMGDYQAAVATTRDCLGRFKSLTAQLEAARRDLNAAEEHLGDYNRRVLQAVEVQFGPDSDEYKAAGGKPPKARKRAVRLPNEPATPPASDSNAPRA
ncbi:MAG: hypothetical protein WCR07_11330 [Verrucomicrobiota bacterium]